MLDNVGPYSQDVLTRIYNVQWGGLAVEFTEQLPKLSYLTLNKALAMNKAVVSFWFRVPAESATKVQQETPDFFWDYRVFQGIIPLITWGQQQTTPVTEVGSVDTGAIDASAAPILIQRVSGAHTAPLQPSTIGVYVGAYPSFPPTLDVHIQTNVKAAGIGLAEIATGWSGDFVGTDSHTGKPVYDNVKYVMEDVSYIVTEEPEYLGNSDANSSNSGAGHPEVAVDKWHHVLMSWDLQSHSNLTGASKMWCAIDDKNKDGFDLPAMCNPDLGMGPNDHMSYTPFSRKGDDSVQVSVAFDASTDVPSNPLLTPGPASANRASDAGGAVVSVNPLATIELAELQIFSGMTLDTSVEKNRRAFIDFERDANGNPIRDQNGKRTLKPVSPAQAEELLGKRPELLLHGTSEWQQGHNTGSTGTNADGNDIPGGQLTSTGEIKPYPGPEIVEA